MALFDKLGGIAKNLGDKASDTMATTKLNGKIKAEKAAIAELQQKIGAYYYERHAAGQEGDPAAAEWLAAIDGHNAAIADLQAEIARIQAENAAQAAPAAPQAYPQAAPIPQPIPVPVQADAPPAAAPAFCTACGAQMAPGMKFCGSCGAQFN